MERRLAAILAADVVGFSRLMGADEAATLAALNRHREELLDPKIAEHKGRVVKRTGDGVLVEFPSVVNAVACAAEIQLRMAERNAKVPKEGRIVFRVGVNVGDVIAEGDDIFGDGVNVAARLESIARPGGIAISGAVRDHIGNRLDLAFEDMGEQTLKHIKQPIRVFGILLGEEPSLAPPTTPKAADGGKPSIAVLPFTNMSGDSEQEYFADGITEDLITDLSKVSGLSVIARNSVFTYKGKAVDTQEVSRRFHASHIVEGSVRKAGQRVRISAQLIDARDGTHLWADRYDRDLTDIFSIQDEITKAIVEQLKVTLLPKEKRAIETAPTQSVDAYTYYLQGRHFYRFHTTTHTLLAERMFRKAIQLDPGYARAYAGIADCASFLSMNEHSGGSLETIQAASIKALELDPSLAEAHSSRGLALHSSGRYPEAIAEFEQAIRLDPGLFDARYHYGWAARNAGDHAKAAEIWAGAVDLAPDDYRIALLLCQAYDDLGRREQALSMARIGLERAQRAIAAYPDAPLAASMGAGTLAWLGERAPALEWASRALTIAPDDPLTQYNIACVYSLLNEPDKALGLLERWRQHANPATLSWLAHDSDLDNIRDHPRFRALLGAAD